MLLKSSAALVIRSHEKARRGVNRPGWIFDPIRNSCERGQNAVIWFNCQSNSPDAPQLGQPIASVSNDF